MWHHVLLPILPVFPIRQVYVHIWKYEIPQTDIYFLPDLLLLPRIRSELSVIHRSVYLPVHIFLLWFSTEMKLYLNFFSQHFAIPQKLFVKSKQWKHKNEVNDVVLVSLLITLNRFCTLFWCFHYFLWTTKYRLG